MMNPNFTKVRQSKYICYGKAWLTDIMSLLMKVNVYSQILNSD